LSPRLGELRLGTNIAALRTRLGDRLVPNHKIALRVVGAAVERLPSLLGAADGDVTTILRTLHPSRHRARAATFRESAAAEEFSRAAVTNDHWRAALVTDLVRWLRRLAIAAQRTSVLAVLRMVLAGEERTEESAARDQLPSALGTFLRPDG